MSFDEIKELCRKSWREEYNDLFIDRSKRSDQGRYCICIGSKNPYTECTSQTKPFKNSISDVYNLKK